MADNLPEKKQDERELKYQLENGREIKLTFEMVRKYLIRGKTESVTLQELVVFMKKCESMQWDPFKDDVYIIKYSANDSAQIVQAIGSKRSKAMQANNCQGWKAGICYIDPDGEYCEREGEILLDGETLVGGWFEARPANWNAPYKHTVNLAPYAKNNQFWSKDKQPHMIRKVAESQGLSALWRDYVGDTYMEGERYADEPISLSRSADGDYAAAPKIDELKKAVSSKDAAQEIIDDPPEKKAVPDHDCGAPGTLQPSGIEGQLVCSVCGKRWDAPYTAPADPMRREETQSATPATDELTKMRKTSLYKNFDPISEAIGKRYTDEKKLRMMDLAETWGVEMNPNWTGSQMHQALKDEEAKRQAHFKGETEPEKGNGSPEPDIDPNPDYENPNKRRFSDNLGQSNGNDSPEPEKPQKTQMAKSEPVKNGNGSLDIPDFEPKDAGEALTADMQRKWARRKAMDQRLADMALKNRVAMGLVDETHTTSTLTAVEAWHLAMFYDMKKAELQG